MFSGANKLFVYPHLVPQRNSLKERYLPGKSLREISLISEKLVTLKQEWREEQISTVEQSLRGCGIYLQYLLQ
jgi:hypothetical protein